MFMRQEIIRIITFLFEEFKVLTVLQFNINSPKSYNTLLL